MRDPPRRFVYPFGLHVNFLYRSPSRIGNDKRLCSNDQMGSVGYAIPTLVTKPANFLELPFLSSDDGSLVGGPFSTRSRGENGTIRAHSRNEKWLSASKCINQI